MTYLLLGAIMVLGAVLRFYGLEVQSLWNDELSTWSEASRSSWLEVVKSSDPQHPPGFSLLLHFWIGYLGDSEAMMRLPSAIAGTLVIPVTFLLGRRLYGDAEGLIAAALIAVGSTPIYYSQEARAYAFVMLCAALSTYWLIDVAGALLRRRAPPTFAAVGYVATAVAASYAHYFGLFFVALQGAFVGALLLVRRGSWQWLGLIYGAIVLAYAPWLGKASASLTRGSPGWLAPPKLSWISDCLRFMFNQSNELTLAFLGLGGVALTLELWRTRAEPQRLQRALSSPTALLLVWVIAPIAIIYLRSVYVAPAFTNRNFLIVAPALYLLVARAVTGLALPRVVTFAGACLLTILLAAHLVWWKDYYRVHTKDEFRQAAAYLVARDDPAAVAVVLAAAWNPRYFNYYLERLGSARRVDRLAVAADDADPVIRLIDQRAPDDVWFLAAHRIPDGRLVEALKRRFRLIDERHFAFAHAWRFRYEPKPPAH